MLTEETILCSVLKRVIERGQTEGLEKKMDVFCAAHKLTLEQYEDLLAMLKTAEV